MATLTVGTDKQFTTVSAAIAASADGDTILVDAGTYTNDFAHITTDITLTAVGGMVHMDATESPPDGKAIFVTNGNITINGFEFSGAQVPDQNGAGIRYEVGDLTINDCYFHDNEMGILAGGNAPGTGTITIDDSEFANNYVRNPISGDYFGHNLYIGEVANLIVTDSYFHDAQVGHEIKSRAENTTITNNRIQDQSGTGSLSIDLPNGGNATVTGNVIEQGPNSENRHIMSYGAEGLTYASNSLVIDNNVFLNDEPTNQPLLYNASGVPTEFANNAVFGLTAAQLPSSQTGTTFLTVEPPLDTSHPFGTPPPAPEIAVTGNGTDILDGDTAPSSADQTDFGSATQNGAAVQHTFTVRNDGNTALTTSGLSLPSGFSLVEPLSGSIAANTSDTFTVQLDTASTGTKSGDISFTDNDSNENPFNFSITGTVNPVPSTPPPAPEIAVTGNGTDILDGDTAPSSADQTDFGSATQNGAAVQHTFTVRNDGNTALTTSGLSLPSGFSLVEPLSGSIAANTSDTFTVQLDTASTGTKSGDISFTDNDSNENPFNFSITGTVNPVPSTPPPAPEIAVTGNGTDILDGDTAPSSADQTDFGSATQNGAAVQHTFTVRNDGNTALTTSGLSLPSGFSLVEPLSGSIAANTSDTFTVQLDTASTGTKSGDISFTDNDSNENPFNFSITGTVNPVPSTPPPAPEIAVTGNGTDILDGDTAPSSADQTDFGSATQNGAAVQHTFTVRNDGNTALTTSGLSLPSGFSLVEPLSGSIAANTSDTFTVQLDTASTGTKSGDISFTDNDSNENPFNFSITGTVNPVPSTPPPAPEIAVTGNGTDILDGDTAPSSADQTDFGSATQNGAAVQHTFTVRNDGNTALTTSRLSLPSGFSLVEPLSGSIAANTSDTFTVQLDTASTGTKSGDISFTDNDSNENPFNFSITGTVNPVPSTPPPAPEIAVTGNGTDILDGDTAPSSADQTDFGSATQNGAAVQHTFTVRNDGNTALTTSGLSLPSGFSLVEPLSGSIAANTSDTFTVQLDTASTGTKSGDISFTDNDSNENPFNFSITGTVNPVPSTPPPAPEIAVTGNGTDILDGDTAPSSADQTDFGSATQNGAAVQHTFTVRNDGNTALTTSGLSLPSGFSLVEPLSGSIAANTSDTFTVQLDTASTGTKSGDISFTDNDSNENPFNFSITGTVNPVPSTPPPAPEIAVTGNGTDILDGDTAPSSADQTDFGSATQNGAAVQHTFTVRNDGNTALTTSGLSLPSGFSLVEPLSGSIAANTSDTFTVQLDTASTGTKSGDISFTDNDSNENPFNFSITGTVNRATRHGEHRHQERRHQSGSIAANTSDTFTVRTKSGDISFTDNDSNENPFNFSITGTVNPVPSGPIPIPPIDDFNGDDKSDILWRNDNGDVYLWNSTPGNGAPSFTFQDLGPVTADWSIVKVTDLNRDGRADILWRNVNGDTYLWASNAAGAPSFSYHDPMSASPPFCDIAEGVHKS